MGRLLLSKGAAEDKKGGLVQGVPLLWVCTAALGFGRDGVVEITVRSLLLHAQRGREFWGSAGAPARPRSSGLGLWPVEPAGAARPGSAAGLGCGPDHPPCSPHLFSVNK